jgi:hypothetical protein
MELLHLYHLSIPELISNRILHPSDVAGQGILTDARCLHSGLISCSRKVKLIDLALHQNAGDRR